MSLELDLFRTACRKTGIQVKNDIRKDEFGFDDVDEFFDTSTPQGIVQRCGDGVGWFIFVERYTRIMLSLLNIYCALLLRST